MSDAVPFPVIARHDEVRLADGRRGLVVESYETSPGRRWLTVAVRGTAEAVYCLASGVVRVEGRG